MAFVFLFGGAGHSFISYLGGDGHLSIFNLGGDVFCFSIWRFLIEGLAIYYIFTWEGMATYLLSNLGMAIYFFWGGAGH